MVKISPEWVTGPEQGKCSGRIATFSLWTDMFRDGIDIDNKLHNYLKITGILNNVFKPQKKSSENKIKIIRELEL